MRRPRLRARGRRTVRLRLMLLYGALFLVTGTVLLAFTYGLVVHSTRGFIFASGDGSAAVATTYRPPDNRRVRPASATRASERARDQHDSVLRRILWQMVLALAVMALVSIGLGWIVAGRVLRPLRTITTATRRISASNLDERLRLDGPRDELTELGDTIDDLLARLERAFESQREFVANASHELRTPLARQRTIAQVAVADPDASVASLRAAHERVLASGAQQERLIDALLALSRSHAGVERREPFNLAELAGAGLRARHSTLAEHRLSVTSDLRPAQAAGSPRLAERLVANLLDNAIGHNIAGGELDVTTGMDGGAAVVVVANSGPSVPEDALERIVQPFQRLDAERTNHGDGIGLGLSIVQAIADAHGARLELRPRPGGGLVVSVRFPAP
jgi:signal transduction histidine kinase